MDAVIILGGIFTIFGCIICILMADIGGDEE